MQLKGPNHSHRLRGPVPFIAPGQTEVPPFEAAECLFADDERLAAPGSAAPLFLIPPVLACLSLGLLLVGIRSWRKRCWQRAWREYYSLVSLACIGFVAFLGYWGLF